MPVDRELWQSEISAHHVPNWPCPGCGAASLTLAKDSFHTVFDGSTTREIGNDYFDNEMITGRFVCLLKCSKVGCQEACAVSGDHNVTEGGERGEHYYATGRPRSITPPPPMLPIPKRCPKSIEGEVCAAFALYWLDHASSLNRIRNAIGLMLTEMGIKRHSLKSGGGRIRLTLDARIQVLRSKKPAVSELCDRLLAVKHLGNAGSHPGNVHIDDVFDGFDILEQVLAETYTNHTSVLAKMVKQINQRKGPRKQGSPPFDETNRVGSFGSGTITESTF